MEVLLLDDGEIAVRSDYLSPGYWRDEALTSQRFSDGLFRPATWGGSPRTEFSPGSAERTLR
jgi:long-subunit acyl-CoA synthetase (AMP-forming)